MTSGQGGDVQFKEMLKNMGKASRKKFDQLAGLFSKRKRGFGGKGSGDGGTALGIANQNRNSRDFLIRDDEYREFENDDTSGSERADSPAFWNTTDRGSATDRRNNAAHAPSESSLRRRSGNHEPRV